VQPTVTREASGQPRRAPARVVVFLDADYSDHPELLPDLVAPIRADDADFVLGSRLLGKREAGAMPLQSLFGNRLACHHLLPIDCSQSTR